MVWSGLLGKAFTSFDQIDIMQEEDLLLLCKRLGVIEQYDGIVGESYTTFVDGNLISLNLSNLKLDTIPLGVFDAFTNLVYLDLSHNLIYSLSSSLFEFLRSLKYLNLSHNKLSTLPSQIFNGLEKLSLLNLSSNRLEELDDYLFEDLNQLQILDLSDNKLQHLPSSIEDLDSLMEFNPARNPLKLQ